MHKLEFMFFVCVAHIRIFFFSSSRSWVDSCLTMERNASQEGQFYILLLQIIFVLHGKGVSFVLLLNVINICGRYWYLIMSFFDPLSYYECEHV